MEKAAAYAISAFLVGFGLWILIADLSSSAPALWICAALIPIAIGLISACRPHLKSGCRDRRFSSSGRDRSICSEARYVFEYQDQQWLSTGIKVAPHGSLRLGNLNRLSQDLALLVRGQKCDIRRIPATADADNAFNRRKLRRVNQPPTIFEINFEDSRGSQAGLVEARTR